MIKSKDFYIAIRSWWPNLPPPEHVRSVVVTGLPPGDATPLRIDVELFEHDEDGHKIVDGGTAKTGWWRLVTHIEQRTPAGQRYQQTLIPPRLEPCPDPPDALTTERLMEGMERAWGLIANADPSGVLDGPKRAEWVQARDAWRDNYWHPALEAQYPELRGETP